MKQFDKYDMNKDEIYCQSVGDAIRKHSDYQSFQLIINLNTMRKFINFISKISLKTIYFNFKYFPIRQAIRLPVLISKKVYLQKTSGKIIFECPIRTGLVQIGYGKIGIFDNKRSRSMWGVLGDVVFQGRTQIGHGSKISVGKNGTLIFGKNFAITAESSIAAHCKIQFGDNCLLSWDILVMDTDFHSIKDENGVVLNSSQPIIIGNNVWIGCRSLILKKTNIPNNCIIGANSIVNRVLTNENCVYAGNPVICIKKNVTWEKTIQENVQINIPFSELSNY